MTYILNYLLFIIINASLVFAVPTAIILAISILSSKTKRKIATKFINQVTLEKYSAFMCILCVFVMCLTIYLIMTYMTFISQVEIIIFTAIEVARFSYKIFFKKDEKKLIMIKNFLYEFLARKK